MWNLLPNLSLHQEHKKAYWISSWEKEKPSKCDLCDDYDCKLCNYGCNKKRDIISSWVKETILIWNLWQTVNKNMFSYLWSTKS